MDGGWGKPRGRSGVLQRDYEVTFILSTTLDEEASAATIERVNQLILNAGGSVTEVHAWGRRHLAYPIEKQRDGFYVTTRFAAPTLAVISIENDLRLNEGILRHLIVRQDEVPIRPIVPPSTMPQASAGSRRGSADADANADVDMDEEDDGGPVSVLDETIDPDLIPAAED
jgi:small subunit ribosomal protein S6